MNEIINSKGYAVGYCRVSTLDQIDNQSLGNQEKACRDEIEKDGYTVLKIIIDKGKSGGNRNRKGIQEIIELVKNKKRLRPCMQCILTELQETLCFIFSLKNYWRKIMLN